MKKIGAILMAAAMSMSLVSCGDDDKEIIDGGLLVFGVDPEEMFSYVYNEASGQANLYDNVGVTVATIRVKDATMIIENARFAEQMPAITFKLEDLINTPTYPYEYLINGENLTPMVGEKAMDNYEVDDLEFKVVMNIMGYNCPPAIKCAYTVNDMIKVRMLLKENGYTGDTNVKCEAAGTSFDNANTVYHVSLDPETKQADLKIYGAKFAERMPAMDMEFKDVPFEATLDGYTLASESLIPEIDDVPYEGYPITNLSGASDFEGNMVLKFVCTIRGVAYEVSANLYVPEQKW